MCIRDSLYTWDPVNFDQWFSFEFAPGVRSFEGEWMGPFSYGSSLWTSKDTYYDGWSGTTTKGVHHCKSTWGDMMTSGGFTTIGVTGWTRFYEFNGPDGPGFGSFNVFNCNDKDMQK